MNTTPFWKPALETLQDLASEPVASIYELRLLQAQIESAIGMIERNELKAMSEQERLNHASRFGRGAFVVGDFVIRKLSL